MSSSSEDDVPLAARAAQVQKPPNSNGAAAPTSNGAASRSQQPTPTSSRPASGDSDSEDDASSSEASSSDESDDDIPLSQRKKAAPAKKPAAKKQPAAAKRKREASSSAAAKRPKRGDSKGGGGKSGNSKKWDTLVHCGVLFPPEYEPHGVKMLYDGKPVELTPEQEEVASMFAIMKETDYMNKPIFLKNFWEGFREVRGYTNISCCICYCSMQPTARRDSMCRQQLASIADSLQPSLLCNNGQLTAQLSVMVCTHHTTCMRMYRQLSNIMQHGLAFQHICRSMQQAVAPRIVLCPWGGVRQGRTDLCFGPRS